MTHADVIISYGNKVYTLSAYQTLPEFIEDALKNNQSLKKNVNFQNRLEILQGFQFSSHSNQIRLTINKRYLGVSGMYPPDLLVYDLDELAIKFVRRIDSEIRDFIWLTEDYKKLAILRSDKVLEFHDQGGLFFKFGIPFNGTKLLYNKNDAILYIATTDHLILRIDLSEGKFLKSLETVGYDVRCIAYHKLSKKLIAGTVTGTIEIFDNNNLDPVNIFNHAEKENYDNSLKFLTCDCSEKSSQIAFGTNLGKVYVFNVNDISTPLFIKDHKIISPITDVRFSESFSDIGEHEIIISSDINNIKVYQYNGTPNLDNIVSIPSIASINAVLHFPRSGMIFSCLNTQKMALFYVPTIGIAPIWIPFVDCVVDEIDSSVNKRIYSDFVFITHRDIRNLGFSLVDVQKNVIPYHHGFLINKNKHQELLMQANIIDEKEIIDEFIENRRKKEIKLDPYNISINKNNENLPSKQEIPAQLKAFIDTPVSHTKKIKKQKQAAVSVAKDTRFNELFD